MEALLPQVPYRQWVFVIAKRLRYFVHRDARLVGKLGRILTETLTRFYRNRTLGRAQSKTDPFAAPAQLLFVQRFGSAVNLHIHVHAVVSDGRWLQRQGALVFEPAPAPTPEEIQQMVELLRRRILRRFLKIRAIPQETAEELLEREHGGFSLHAQTCTTADDRDGLKRLLNYCTRPAISIKRLRYLPEKERVRYQLLKSQPGQPDILQWHPLEFLSRFAQIIPPPWINLVRYAGALGPRAKLRPLITQAAKQAVRFDQLRNGWRPPRFTAPAHAKAAGRILLTAAQKAWAVCLRKVFEVYPLTCVCGAEMVLSAIILEDSALVKILTRLGLPTAFPVLKPARDPPQDAHSQINAEAERWYGIDEP